MLTGEENVNSLCVPNANGESQYTFGITLKQHMVIEFTKALLSNSNLSDHTNVNDSHWRLSVECAICISNEVIKQLNEE